MKRTWLAIVVTLAAVVALSTYVQSQSAGRQPWAFVSGTCATQVFGAVWSTPQTLCGGTGTTFDSRQAYAPAIVKDVARVEAPCPGFVTGAVCYRMWYTGDRSEGTTRIGYAVSPDGITWTRVPGTADGGSVLGPGAAGSFESAGPAYARVMLDGSVLRMWYAAYDTNGNSAIGYATSVDGRLWTRIAGPLGGAVLKASGVVGTFDSDSVDTPYVIKDVATAALPCAGVAAGATCYRMWYEGVNYPGGYKFRIGYATSPDGIAWTRVAGTSPTRAVLDSAPYPEFDDNSLGVPVVIKEGAIFRMWYEAKDFNDVFQVGSVSSADGVRWTRPSPNASVWQGSKDPGTDLVPHYVWASDVIKEGASYRLWYSTTVQPSSVRIGHAAMTPGSPIALLSVSAVGTTYTVSFGTAKAIPATGSLLLTIGAGAPAGNLVPVGLSGFGAGAALQYDAAAVSDALAPHTTRGALIVRFSVSEAAGQKSVSFQLPSALAAPTALVVQSFDALDVLEQGTVMLAASSGGGCTYAIGPTPQVFGAAGGASTVSLTTGSTCAWTATSNAAWMTVTPPASGTGSSSVGFTVGANTGLARNGTATVAGQTLAVSQAAVPTPTATLTASPTSIAAGGSAVLTWTTTNAATVSIDQGIGPVTASGSRTVNPAATATYTLTVTNPSGTATAAATVTVNSVVPPPTASLSLSPTSIVTGGSATLMWSTTNATTISIDQGIGAVSASGSRTVNPAATTTYTLTASSGGSTATSAATLTVTGASSGNRSSLAFNGTNAQARFTTLPAMTVLTVEAWVKRTVAKGQYETFVANAANGYGQETFGLYVDGGNADCGASPPSQLAWAYTQATGGWFFQCSGVTASLNTWYHVAVTRDSAGTARIFVNGVLKATQASTPPPTSSTGALGVGLAGDAVTEHFAGRVDELRISNAVRYTASFTPQVANFASDASTVALYHFDEGTGQIIGDASPNNRSGVLGVSPAVETIDPVWTADVPFP